MIHLSLITSLSYPAIPYRFIVIGALKVSLLRVPFQLISIDARHPLSLSQAYIALAEWNFDVLGSSKYPISEWLWCQRGWFLLLRGGIIGLGLLRIVHRWYGMGCSGGVDPLIPPSRHIWPQIDLHLYKIHTPNFHHYLLGLRRHI